MGLFLYAFLTHIDKVLLPYAQGNEQRECYTKNLGVWDTQARTQVVVIGCLLDTWLLSAVSGVTRAAWASNDFIELPSDLTPANCRLLHALRLLCCLWGEAHQILLALPKKLGDASPTGLTRDESR